MNILTTIGKLSEGHGAWAPVPAIQGDPMITFDGQPMVREGDLYATHCDTNPTCHSPTVVSGNPMITLNGIPAAYVGGALSCGDVIAEGVSEQAIVMTTATPRRIKFSDISKTGPNLTNVDSVVNAIENIINTRIGERIFNRQFGSRIEDYLHEPFSFAMGRLILSELMSSILKWEKRVTISPSTDVNANPDTRKYEVTLYIEIEGFSDPVLIEEEFTPKV